MSIYRGLTNGAIRARRGNNPSVLTFAEALALADADTLKRAHSLLSVRLMYGFAKLRIKRIEDRLQEIEGNQ